MIERSHSDESAATIRELRSLSNAAIASREIQDILAIMHEDIKVITSYGKFHDGVGDAGQAFAKAFANPDFVTYVRQPLSIDVQDLEAAEAGNWSGEWKKEKIGGTYLARWSRGSKGWLIIAELFVPLARTSLVLS